MSIPDVSRRGVYYKLEISPYRYITPKGDIFKFSSQKKLEIYTRKIQEFKEGVKKILDKHKELGVQWRCYTWACVEKYMYEYMYKEVER